MFFLFHVSSSIRHSLVVHKGENRKMFRWNTNPSMKPSEQWFYLTIVGQNKQYNTTRDAKGIFRIHERAQNE